LDDAIRRFPAKPASANDAWVAKATVVDVQAAMQGGALSAEELRLHFSDLGFIDPLRAWRAKAMAGCGWRRSLAC
jgi:hypothetical protein